LSIESQLHVTAETRMFIVANTVLGLLLCLFA